MSLCLIPAGIEGYAFVDRILADVKCFCAVSVAVPTGEHIALLDGVVFNIDKLTVHNLLILYLRAAVRVESYRKTRMAYCKNYTGNKELYQTVYSKDEHSAAAPTAGLHFTQELIERIKAKGIEFKTVNLEVGLDTFRVVDEMDPKEHKIHTEFYSVPQETVDAIIAAKARGNKVIAVGTTSVRSLESAWDKSQEKLVAREREATSLYILPGYTFNVVDGLITNFHVPRSTLMMLVSAFSTRDNIMKAYRHAIKRQYRFLSFGDAMFIR